MQFVKPIPYGEAIEKIGSRTPIGSKLSSSEWSDVPVALRERAMFSARVESIRFLQRSQDAIGDFLSNNTEILPNGKTAFKTGGRAQFIEQLRELALREGMGPLDPADRGRVTDITSERRLGLIFDVLTQQANDFGYRKQGLDPAVLNEFPAQRFIRVKDVKEPRDWHTNFLDQVYLKTDPIWKTINRDFSVPWGPWGWGCGHDVEDVDREEAVELGLLRPGEQIEPPMEDFNDALKASIKGLDPALIQKMREAFGPQLIIEGETARWARNTQPPRTAPTPVPTPLAAPVPTQPAASVAPEVPQRVSPVSSALDIKVSGSARESVLSALSAIDQVHDDGTLPKIPLDGRPSQGALGMLSALTSRLTGISTSAKISVKRDGPWPALTTVHEVGHFLDLEAIGTKGFFSSAMDNSPLKPVIEASSETESIRFIVERLTTTKSLGMRRQYKYLLQPEEIWARAYAQFIAEKSQNATLLRELQIAIEHTHYRQWSTEDFAPVRQQIERVFHNLGWL